MPIGSILAGLVLFLVTIPFVVRPLLNERHKELATVESTQAATGDSHKAALFALRDVEFDHRTGKITDEDYAGLRANLMAQAAATLELNEKQNAELDAQIEAEVRGRRQRASQSRAVRFCAQCGHAVKSNDRFCAVCGTRLADEIEAVG